MLVAVNDLRESRRSTIPSTLFHFDTHTWDGGNCRVR
jgi:hypothetical protein